MDEAAVIVRGQVVSTRVERHPELTGLWTVFVTLRVEETLKGEAGPTFTFRQFIWDARERYDAAGYGKGQHLLLLMIRPSAYGLSSPAGLSPLDSVIEIVDSSGKRLTICALVSLPNGPFLSPCLNDDMDPTTLDSALFLEVPPPPAGR